MTVVLVRAEDIAAALADLQTTIRSFKAEYGYRAPIMRDTNGSYILASLYLTMSNLLQVQGAANQRGPKQVDL